MRDATAVAAACMARGLSADEALAVWDFLQERDLPTDVVAAYAELKAAFDQVVPWRDCA